MSRDEPRWAFLFTEAVKNVCLQKQISGSGHFETIVSKNDPFTEVGVTEPPNYDGPQVHVIAIMTFDSRTYVHHNLKGLLSSE
jgi:hypothetical protein